MTTDATTAIRRFGLGARPGDLKRIAADPRGYVLGQLAQPTAVRIDRPDLDHSHVVFAAAQEAQQTQRLAQAIKKAAQPAAAAPAPGMAAAEKIGTEGGKEMAAAPAGAAAKKSLPGIERPAAIRRDALIEEQAARISHAVVTDSPFLERLVMFWSNHFCVAFSKGPVRGLAGGYEREAIRPHVLGRFADMLRAVEQHPAMLIYLDNQNSIGPNSQAGRNRGRGLNENLAREILELHTVGVDGGYRQEDVTNLARIITGWSVGNLNQPQTEPGKFFYAANHHEPGAWTVLAKRYEDQGRKSGEMVLDDLARHPATARHIARKLARHFVADAPPPALVTLLEKTFRDSDGNLREVARVLATAGETWSAPAKKIVPPYDYVVALARGFEAKTAPGELVRLAGALGQPLWNVPSPKGWPDTDDSWMGPAPIRERLRIAEKLAREVPAAIDPRERAAEMVGPALSEATRQAVARAETREQGLQLVAMAPEFLRR
jgi:uncharacterized protein (DUF1800 family)